MGVWNPRSRSRQGRKPGGIFGGQWQTAFRSKLLTRKTGRVETSDTVEDRNKNVYIITGQLKLKHMCAIFGGGHDVLPSPLFQIFWGDVSPLSPAGFTPLGHGSPKVAKMADFKVCLLRLYACNQKTNGRLWHSKTISKFYRNRFLIFVLVWRHVTFKVRVLRGVNWQSRIGLIYCNLIFWSCAV